MMISDAKRRDCEWPHQEASRFVRTDAVRWHVQQFGSGPGLLLVHGTGSACLSWRDVAPILARHFTVIAPDLPGHGRTAAPSRAQLSLPAMAASLTALLRELRISPAIVAGHSAGAAVLARMALDHAISPRVLVSINGALLPLRGLPRWLYSPIAKLVVHSDLLPRLVARRAADSQVIARLIDDTGSKLDSAGVELYRQLAQRPEHVAAALGMMANWDLRSLERDLPRLRIPLSLWTAANDRTIAPTEALRVQRLLPAAEIVSLGALGHLAHEERPQHIAGLLLRTAARFTTAQSRASSRAII
jgi:magnesium chelatase accessory protein